MKHRIDHAPDRLRAGHGRVLLGSPSVDDFDLTGLETDTYESAGYGGPLPHWDPDSPTPRSVGDMSLPIPGEIYALAALNCQRRYAVICCPPA
jgi:hypothetical protein